MKKIWHTYQTEDMADVMKDQMNWNPYVNRTQNNMSIGHKTICQ